MHPQWDLNHHSANPEQMGIWTTCSRRAKPLHTQSGNDPDSQEDVTRGPLDKGSSLAQNRLAALKGPGLMGLAEGLGSKGHRS